MALQTISNDDLARVAGGAGDVLAAGAAGAWTGLSVGKYVGHPAAGAAVGGVVGAAAAGVAKRDPWCLAAAVPAAIGGLVGGGPLGATAAAAGACAGGALLHDEYDLLGRR